MTPPVVRSEYSIGRAGVGGEAEVISYNRATEKWDGTSRIIICLHGHGTAGQDLNNPLQFQQLTGFAGQHATALARTGRYIICAIQAGGSSPWSNPAVMDDITTAVNAMRARGGKAGKYGILGYSMGGLAALNKLKRDFANLAAVWCWAPAADLDYAYSGAGNATWTAEIDAAFGSYAATAGYRVHDEPASFRGLGVPTKLCHATNDATVPVSLTTDFVAAVNDPLITQRAPDILGGHTALFAYVSNQEVTAFFDAGAW